MEILTDNPVARTTEIMLDDVDRCHENHIRYEGFFHLHWDIGTLSTNYGVNSDGLHFDKIKKNIPDKLSNLSAPAGPLISHTTEGYVKVIADSLVAQTTQTKLSFNQPLNRPSSESVASEINQRNLHCEKGSYPACLENNRAKFHNALVLENKLKMIKLDLESSPCNWNGILIIYRK